MPNATHLTLRVVEDDGQYTVTEPRADHEYTADSVFEAIRGYTRVVEDAKTEEADAARA